MDILLTVIAIIFSWRFLACLSVAIVIAFLLGNYLGSVAAFSIVCIGVGLGCIWQGRWLYGITTSTSIHTRPISKLIAFFGYAFVGAIWGSLSSVLLNSMLGAALFLVVAVILVGAWLTVILRKHNQLNNLFFAVFSLLIGLGGICALGIP